MKEQFRAYFTTLVILLALVFGATQYAFAAINKQIHYQGVLKTAAGAAVSDGSYDIVFNLYTAASGGTAIWTGTHTAANSNAVTVADTVFSVLLGSGTGNTLADVNFDQDELYLGVTVGSDSEMTPRQRVGSAAYAFNADKLDGFNASDLIQFATTSYGVATSTVYGFTGGLFSTASSTFTSGLQVYGSTTIGGGTQTTGLTIDGGATTTGFLTVQSSATSSFTGGLTAGNLGATSITITGSGTSSFIGAIATGGFTTSEGLVISGGSLINTASATSSFTGGISSAGLASSVGLTITGGATSTSNNGFNITAGCYAVGGTCTNTFASLTDTQSSLTANRILFTNSAGTAITDNSLFLFDGTNLALGTTSLNYLLTVDGIIESQSFVATSTTATSTIKGGLSLGNGEFYFENGSGNTYISQARLGNITFEDDAGMVQWTDLSVSGSVATGTIQRYTAFLDSVAAITVYGIANQHTVESIDNLSVGIGTSTPSARLTVWGGGKGEAALFNVVNSASSTKFTILSDGTVGVATSTPSSNFAFAVHGNALLGSTTVQGLTATGTLSVLGSGTSTFAGAISAAGLRSTNGVSVTGGNVRLTEATTVGTSTLTVSATGDLTITANGGDVRILDEGLSVCDLAGCPSLPNGRTATSTPGSVFVENVLYFPSTGWSVGTSSSPNTQFELTFYDDTGEAAVIFDSVE